jgi:hypothetical protein
MHVTRAEDALTVLADPDRFRALYPDAKVRAYIEWNVGPGGARLRDRLRADRDRLAALRRTADVDVLAHRFFGQALVEAESRPRARPAATFTAMDLDDAISHARGDETPHMQAFAVGYILFLVIVALVSAGWALLFRGGLAYRLVGIALRRANGRPALRVQCAWRALLFWLPVVALLASSRWLQESKPEQAGLAFGLWCGAGAVLLAYFVLAVRSPARSLHDVLSRTYLVPR